MDGVMRGKYMSKDKFISALDNGFGFCDVVLGWDSKDQLYDNVKCMWHEKKNTIRILQQFDLT